MVFEQGCKGMHTHTITSLTEILFDSSALYREYGLTKGFKGPMFMYAKDTGQQRQDIVGECS